MRVFFNKFIHKAQYTSVYAELADSARGALGCSSVAARDLWHLLAEAAGGKRTNSGEIN